RGLFEARGDINGITCHEALRRARHDLAGVDADAALDAEPRKSFAHLGSSAHCPKGIVLVRKRYAEDRHHRVPDELLHRPAVPLDTRPNGVEVAVKTRLQRFGVERLPECRRPSQITEENRDDLASHECRLERRSPCNNMAAPAERPTRESARTLGSSRAL